MPAVFGRKTRPEQDIPAAPAMSMKRSSNITLIVMGTLAFTASFAGGSAFLVWQKPAQSQNCTTAPDGRQTCPTRRSWVAYLPVIHYWTSPGRGATAAPLSQSASTNAKLVSGTPGTGTSAMGSSAGERTTQRTMRGGFGASGRTVFRSSAAS